VVAAGAVTLRVGGRAALASSIGLDFANDNPELKDNMDQFLTFASSLGTGTEGLLFVFAWTIVKVFCFDAGGVVLALSAGILFGGVLKGAFASAAAATIGSSIAYFLAKIDTPVRSKALDLIEEYPSLRGIEKVVAEDGLKAILTLRLAPVLPIPIGLYNYVYGVTNVPYLDFAGGIFLGSLKPYLLDSYLGVFGKQVVDGTLDTGGGLQDIILLVVLGVSVLIGVFASQLAAETWDAVKEEVEAEQKDKEDPKTDEEDGITRSLFGFDFPDWIIGMQISLKEGEERVEKMIDTEFQAAVWNYTESGSLSPDLDPVNFSDSPENTGKDLGFDFVASIADGFMLSPSLFKAYFKFADPFFNDTEDILKLESSFADKNTTRNDFYYEKEEIDEKELLMDNLSVLRSKTEEKLKRLEIDLNSLSTKY
jgi:uncharacterized membrane protein YdjX (TVP38/TMEM64 family)